MPRACVPFSDSPTMMSEAIPRSPETSERVSPETSEILSLVRAPSSSPGKRSKSSVATMAPRMESPRNSSLS